MGFLKKLAKKINLKSVIKTASFATAFIPGVGPVASKLIDGASKAVDKRQAQKNAMQQTQPVYQAPQNTEMLQAQRVEEQAQAFNQLKTELLPTTLQTTTPTLQAIAPTPGLKEFWLKYKSYIIGASALLVAYFLFFKKTEPKKSYRKY